MYSKAKLAGHPVHPMLVAFPIAFYTAAVATLVVYALTRDAFWFRAAMTTHIAGVVMALVAFIPGVIDLLALPRRSRARSTGYQHAIANLASTTAFAISAVILWREWHGTDLLAVAAPLAIGVIGLGALAVAGFLGSSLVRKHHVGVRPTRFVQTGPHRTLAEIDDLDELPARTLRNTDIGRPAPATWH